MKEETSTCIKSISKNKNKGQKRPDFFNSKCYLHKINLNGGQFYKEISKFDYFNNLQSILKKKQTKCAKKSGG